MRSLVRIRLDSEDSSNIQSRRQKQNICLTNTIHCFYYFCLMKILARFFSILMIMIVMSCNSSDNNNASNTTNASGTVAVISYTIAAAYPHDTSSFTEGLLFYNGQLYESTGNYGKSKLLQIDLKTGQPVQEINLPESYFGEGISILRDTVYQLTWKEKTVLMYDVKTFKKIGELPLNTEGWGMTTDGTHLIASDGSSNLYFYEPGTFKLLHTQGVTIDGAPAINLNELEYINGYIYANQWQYNTILKIDPNSGQVVGRMDLTDMANRIKMKFPQADFLNGIAYNADTKKVYVTGKWWPELYEIAFPF